MQIFAVLILIVISTCACSKVQSAGSDQGTVDAGMGETDLFDAIARDAPIWMEASHDGSIDADACADACLPTWTQTSIPVPPGAQSFGCELAISSDEQTLVVSDCDAHAVTVHTLRNGIWGEGIPLVFPEDQQWPAKFLGLGVAASGDGEWIAAGFSYGPNAMRGVAVFRRDGARWTWTATHAYLSSERLAISDDAQVLVGDSRNFASSEFVVLERTGSGPHEPKDLSLTDNNFPRFATALSRDGATLVLALASSSGQPSRSWVYVHDGLSWRDPISLESFPLFVGEQQRSVAVSGNGRVIVVGNILPAAASNGSTGAVLIYSRQNNGHWTEPSFVPWPAAAVRGYGSRLAISDDGLSIAVGSNDSVEGNRLFVHTQFGLQEMGFEPTVDRSGSNWALSFSANGRMLVVGIPSDGPGRVEIFKRQSGS